RAVAVVADAATEVARVVVADAAARVALLARVALAAVVRRAVVVAATTRAPGRDAGVRGKRGRRRQDAGDQRRRAGRDADDAGAVDEIATGQPVPDHQRRVEQSDALELRDRLLHLGERNFLAELTPSDGREILGRGLAVGMGEDDRGEPLQAVRL